MARVQDETRFAQQRDRVLKAAAHCFNRKGYSGTSLKDVANMLGLTDPALYYYVRNKEELVYLCYIRAADIGRDAMERAIADGRTGLERVRLYLRYHIESMVGEEGPMAIMSEIPSLESEHREEILRLSRKHGADFEALLETGIEDGSIEPCDIRMTGNAIMGALNWIPKWYRPNKSSAENIVRDFPTTLVRGLAAAPKKDPGQSPL